MKKYLLPLITLFAMLFSGTVSSQILEPVKWKFTSEPVKGKPGEYMLYFDATIDMGWNVYSQFLKGDGPVPTSVRFDDSTQVKFMAKPGESGPRIHDEFDKLFDMQIKKFEQSARFTQHIKLLNDKKPLKGSVEYMTCSDKCIFPDPAKFTFNLTAASGSTETPAKKDSATTKVAIAPTADTSSAATTTPAVVPGANVINEGAGACYNKDLLLENLHLKPTDHAKESMLTIFFLGFLGGLVALLTPCVFPLIPLTVSFFTKGSGKGKNGILNAFLYSFFIFLIYVLLSLPFRLVDNLDAGILNTISTNVYLNVGFFVIFVAFAISFFGFYEIGLPSGLGNKIDSASDIGGVLGIFFMALTLAIVSFSCTGPILGTLLGLTAQKGGSFANQLTAGMAGFGLALALPFGLFAAFPSWLNSLPKSGGWLNTIKVVIGFVELALALKFLSNADLVQHWGILKREVYIGIWVLIGIATILYLFKAYRFPHDPHPKKHVDGTPHKPMRLSMGRLLTAGIAIAFTLYLLPGLTNTPYANLSLISGFPPPLYYSIYSQPSETKTFENHKNDLCAAMDEAQRTHKPVMIDFTGFACVNCRKMEENVWPDDAVYHYIKDNYVLVSLYVDDREKLPVGAQITLNANGETKTLETVGMKWKKFQELNFANNSQPYYALISPDGKLLADPVGYTPDKQQYIAFLEKGLQEYKKGKR